MPGTQIRNLTRTEKAWSNFRDFVYEAGYWLTCGFYLLEFLGYVVITWALLVFHEKSIKYTVPCIILLNVAALTWFAIELTVMNSPDSLFIPLSSCEVLNVTAAHTISEVGCMASFVYEFLPQGLDDSLVDGRFVTREDTFLASAETNVSLAECVGFVGDVNATIAVGFNQCFLLRSIYTGYKGGLNCAESSPPGLTPFSNICTTLFLPEGSHVVSSVAIGCVAVGLLLVICPASGLAFLLSLDLGGS